jgi:hypothetical protein
MKRVWIFGDSHAAGTGIEPRNPAREYLSSYPCQLARSLGYEQILNYSIGGHSNDAIFRWVTERLPDIDREDLVMLCWSEQGRTEVWSDLSESWLHIIRQGQGENYDTWFEMRPCAGAALGIFDRQAPYPKGVQRYYTRFREAWQSTINADRDLKNCNLNFTKNCLAANTLLRSRNIKVFNIRSQVALDRPYTGVLDPLLQQEYWPVGGTVFRDWALQQGFTEDRYHHLPEPAHTAFSRYIFSSITHETQQP